MLLLPLRMMKSIAPLNQVNASEEFHHSSPQTDGLQQAVAIKWLNFKSLKTFLIFCKTGIFTIGNHYPTPLPLATQQLITHQPQCGPEICRVVRAEAGHLEVLVLPFQVATAGIAIMMPAMAYPIPPLQFTSFIVKHDLRSRAPFKRGYKYKR